MKNEHLLMVSAVELERLRNDIINNKFDSEGLYQLAPTINIVNSLINYKLQGKSNG